MDTFTNYSERGVFSSVYVDSSKSNQDMMQTFSSPDFVLQDSHPKIIRQMGKEFFKLEDGYTNLVDLTALTDGSLFGQGGGLIHFGYLGDKPKVSFRAANESAAFSPLPIASV